MWSCTTSSLSRNRPSTTAVERALPASLSRPRSTRALCLLPSPQLCCWPWLRAPPRAAAADPSASAAKLARRSSSGAAEARRRMSDGGGHEGMRNGPCGARFGFSDVTSSDDDDLSSSNVLLLLCADALSPWAVCLPCTSSLSLSRTVPSLTKNP